MQMCIPWLLVTKKLCERSINCVTWCILIIFSYALTCMVLKTQCSRGVYEFRATIHNPQISFGVQFGHVAYTVSEIHFCFVLLLFPASGVIIF